MPMIYERFDVEEETPVQFVGVYVTRWRPEWGQPTVMFSEADAVYQAAPEMLEALKHVLVAALVDDRQEIWSIAKAAIDRAQGG